MIMGSRSEQKRNEVNPHISFMTDLLGAGGAEVTNKDYVFGITYVGF